MSIVYSFLWIVGAFLNRIEGEYCLKKRFNNTGGSLQHISTLKLNADKSYLYTDIGFDKSGQFISGDTMQGTWYAVGDTVITENYNVKWLVKRNSIVKLSPFYKLKYRKKR